MEVVRIEPIAEDLAESVTAARTDQRLKWQGDETMRNSDGEDLSLRLWIYADGRGARRRLREASRTLLAGNG